MHITRNKHLSRHHSKCREKAIDLNLVPPVHQGTLNRQLFARMILCQTPVSSPRFTVCGLVVG